MKPIFVILQKIVNKILTSYHELLTGEHTVKSRINHKIQSKYYWITLIKDTTEFNKFCLICRKNKKLKGI